MRLSDFKGEKAFEVAAGLIAPMAKIAESEIFKKTNVTSRMELAEIILKADVMAAKEILSILSDIPTELYVCTGAEILRDILEAVSDDDFLSLFILPRQKTEDGAFFSVSVRADV